MAAIRVLVVDGQGGGVGKVLVERLRLALGKDVFITAIGTNSLATSLMLKAGADAGATGENAILVNAPQAEVIMGAIGIIAADAMLGELSPPMARAIGSSQALKILVPLNRCNLQVVGIKTIPFASLIDEAVESLKLYRDQLSG